MSHQLGKADRLAFGRRGETPLPVGAIRDTLGSVPPVLMTGYEVVLFADLNQQ